MATGHAASERGEGGGAGEDGRGCLSEAVGLPQRSVREGRKPASAFDRRGGLFASLWEGLTFGVLRYF